MKKQYGWFLNRIGKQIEIDDQDVRIINQDHAIFLWVKQYKTNSNVKFVKKNA